MSAPALVDRLGRPYAVPVSGRVGSIARIAGGHGGTMSGWLPRRNGSWSAPRERELIARRAEELAANDAHAAGLITGLTVNTTGTGLVPQSQVDATKLGITDEDAVNELRETIEVAFDLWSDRADAGGRMNFYQLQRLNMRTALIQGEFLNLCVNTANTDGSLPPNRLFAMALQSLSPQRIQTPWSQWSSPNVRDGVELGRFGEPVAYYIAQPDASGHIGLGSLAECVRYPASIAHRPVCLHAFPCDETEQVRGVSVLAPAMKFFRDLNDCLDAELVGQIVTAQVPLAITSDMGPLLQTGQMSVDKLRMRPDDENITEVEPGSVVQLYQGEDIKPLDSPRPGSNFEAFVMRILRAAGAAAGVPYEVVVKDFSKTNYSSARAALLEAWRVFRNYQQWLVASFCRPVWRSVVEEAFARGMITLPAGAPDFYDAMEAYLAVNFIPPRPGHVDPASETDAEIAALDAGITTYADVIAARGGDYDSVFRQRKREKDLKKKLGLSEPVQVVTKPAATNVFSQDATDNPEEESRQ